MNNSPYSQLDKFISEYEEDIKIIRNDKLIIENYPKIFLMYTASLFEVRIKEKLNNNR